MAAGEHQEVDSNFWEWAVRAYARPGVEALLLALQDQHGQCVPLLLWAVWSDAAAGPALDRAAALCRCWEAEVGAPLRCARRALKTPRHPVDDAAREQLRSEVKSAELNAERVLMKSLEALTPAPSPTQATLVLDRLREAAEAFGAGAAPQAALVDLAARLGATPVESPPVLL